MAGEPAHVGAEFREEKLSRPSTHPRDRLQVQQRLLKRAHPLLDLPAQAVDGFVQTVDMPELHGQHEPYMRAYECPQCPFKLLPLIPESPPGQRGQKPRVRMPLDQLLEDGPPRHAQHIASHRTELDAGVFKGPLHPVDL